MRSVSKSNEEFVDGKQLISGNSIQRQAANGRRMRPLIASTKKAPHFCDYGEADGEDRGGGDLGGEEMPNERISTRLFIELSTKCDGCPRKTHRRNHKSNFRESHQTTRDRLDDIHESALRPAKGSCNRQYRSANNYMEGNLAVVLSILIIAISCQTSNFALGQQSVSNQNVGSTPILPTVIVRGFLNYRTTVDGTVLVFTPDAGLGGQTSSVQQPPLTSSATVPLASTTMVEMGAVEPTAVVAPSPFATVVPDVRQSAANGNTNDRSTVDVVSERIDPVATNPDQADEWRPVQATPLLPKPAQQPTPSVAPLEPPAASTTMFIDTTFKSATQPEMVADSADIPPETSTSSKPPNESGTRPKRPSLGFNGQSIRWKPNERTNRLKNSEAGNQQPQTGQIGSINGIRRPGLSTTTSAPTVASESATSETSATNSTRGRARHKFKRPNFSTKPATLPAQQPATPVASVLQPAESGQDLVVGDQMSEALAPASISSSSELEAMGPVAIDPQLSGISGSANLPGAPVVGSDEILAPVLGGGTGIVGEQPSLTKPMSRSGETRPRALQSSDGSGKMLTGQLVSTGSMSGDPLNFDTLFQGDQPSENQQPPTEASEHKPSHSSSTKETGHHAKLHFGKNHANEKLTGWMDQHSHSKYVPRPASTQHEQAGRLSHQLSATLNQLEPSFSSNLPSSASSSGAIKPTPVTALTTSVQLETLKPSVDEITGEGSKHSASQASNNTNSGDDGDSLQLQTITKTYSTIMTSTKTRMVPLQVKSTTAIYTITENYVITKVMTAYQTMPVGEFILPEPLNTRAPFEMFNEVNPESAKENSIQQQQPAQAASAPAISAPIESQEQPISLDTSPKSPNDWLHDFSNLNNPFGQQPNPSQQQTNNNLAAALLEQQAQQANLAGFPLMGEPLDQLASSLDPAALLADGAINIPDLNNPLVLAAAIQNPQLAAVILAAQQLQLQKRQKQLNSGTGNIQQQQPNQQQQQFQTIPLQPSYSTSLSTVIKPSTYTARDTMYTTRLVSFKDGRTTRTRTVSEPGSVIEQVLTTMATEVTPVTITIRPTGALTVPVGPLATSMPGSQTTINNALIATQLASLLARRQQQVQPSLANPALLGSATPQQLTALQQLLGQQQRPQAAKQFQPNLQQLLQSMGQQPQQQPQQQQQQPQQQQAPQSQSAQNSQVTASNNKPGSQQQPVGSEAGSKPQVETPPLAQQPSPAMQPTQPITTVLTNLQVRTYTVHNAFKTIYRTITSTQLVTSTIFPGVRATQMPVIG